jgi:hypothetical protein
MEGKSQIFSTLLEQVARMFPSLDTTEHLIFVPSTYELKRVAVMIRLFAILSFGPREASLTKGTYLRMTEVLSDTAYFLFPLVFVTLGHLAVLSTLLH